MANIKYIVIFLNTIYELYYTIACISGHQHKVEGTGIQNRAPEEQSDALIIYKDCLGKSGISLQNKL